MMKYKLTMMLCGLLTVCNLQADFLPFNNGSYNDGLVPKSQIGFSTGWRWDEVKYKDDFFTFDNVPDGPDYTKYKDLDVLQVGVVGTLALPGGLCDCGWEWLNQFYLDGYAYWGAVSDGKRDFKSFDAEGASLGTSLRNVYAGETYDYQIALGWLYQISCEFGLAPIVGYSWDEQIIRPSTLIKFTETDLPVRSSASHTEHTWKGPFLGLELVYDLCDFRLNAGYEYHWLKTDFAFIRNKFDVNVEECLARKRSVSQDGHGNVGYLGVTYEICDCWALNLQGKYRDFSTDSGRSSYSPKLDLEECGYQKTKQDWKSWELTFDVAYRF